MDPHIRCVPKRRKDPSPAHPPPRFILNFNGGFRRARSLINSLNRDSPVACPFIYKQIICSFRAVVYSSRGVLPMARTVYFEKRRFTGEPIARVSGDSRCLLGLVGGRVARGKKFRRCYGNAGQPITEHRETNKSCLRSFNASELI